jgi:hypothetical protein
MELLEDRTLPSFVAAPTFPVVTTTTGPSAQPVAVVTGDFNGDGILDVATANKGTNNISVLLGLGNGTFRSPTTFTLGRAPAALIAADVNGDGRLDLVTANHDDNSVSVLLNGGGGAFRPAVTFAAGSGPVALAAADLNGDGHKDLAVVDNVSDAFTVLMGNGKGQFTLGGSFAVRNGPTSIALADFNGDGIQDVATVSGGYGHLDVCMGRGDGSFMTPTNYVTGYCANTVVVGDFNHDGQPDLAVACTFPSGDGVSILLGNPDGTFQPLVNYGAGKQMPITLAVGDLNGDGVQDLVTANDQFANNSVSVLTGNGDGSFGTATVYTAGQAPNAVAVGDLNGDGVLDVVVADQSSPVGAIAVLLGNGDGSLLASPDLAVPSPGPLIQADLDGDGITDLAVLTTGGNYNGVMIFPGSGNGSFGAPLQTAPINGPTAIAVGDFNHDGIPDLAVTNGNGVNVLLGLGHDLFGQPQTFAAGAKPAWAAVADFNGDGNLDLAVADNGSGGSVQLLPGNGDGTFQPASSIAAGGPATFVVAADLNGDGIPDLAVVNHSANTVSVAFGIGDGSFQPAHSYATLNDPGSIGIGDFNGDHRPDLAVPTFFGKGASSALSILLQGTGGTFATTTAYTTGSLPRGIAVADLNGDKKLDLATANAFADTVSVFTATGPGTFGTPATYVVGDGPKWLTAADFNNDGLPDLAVVNDNAHTVTLLETPATVATHFRVRIVPTTTTAGVAFQITVTALDSDNRLMTGYTGSVSFTSSDGAALLPAVYKFTATDHGVRRFTVTLRTAGTQSIVAHAGAAAGSGSINVVAAAANHLQVSAAPVTAGAPFDVTVTARDPYGNVATSFAGTVHFTTSDLSKQTALPADYAFTTGDNGVHTWSAGATLITAGLRTITATDPPTTRGPSGSTPVTVQPAGASQLLISAPTSAVAGAPFTVTVTAKDPYSNLATGFTGTVHFTSSGNSALPADYTFTATDKGIHKFTTAVLQTAGSQSLIVSTPGCNDGVQNGIQVKPGAAAQAAIIGQPTNAFAATPQHPAVTVQVDDAYSNPVAAGVSATLALSANPTGAVLGGTVAMTNSAGVATFTGITVSRPGQGYTLIAHSGTGTSEASSPFTIYTATHIGVVASASSVQAGSPFTITVTALDATNQPDPTYVGTVHFTGPTPPLPDYSFQPTDAGHQTFTVTLDHAGTQSITVADAWKTTAKGSATVTVTPAGLHGFTVIGFPLNALHTTAYSFTVTAVDTYGNTITDYQGTVTFTNVGGTALLPSPYAYTTLDKGKHVFKATLQTAGGDQSLAVTDQNDLTVTGTETGITVT